LADGGLSILQYANDTIMFMEHDIAKEVNMKPVIYIFEQLSGIKINFHKSELFGFSKAKDMEQQYIQLWVASLVFYRLGILRYMSII
jgi:hypothetical protein